MPKFIPKGERENTLEASITFDGSDVNLHLNGKLVLWIRGTDGTVELANLRGADLPGISIEEDGMITVIR